MAIAPPHLRQLGGGLLTEDLDVAEALTVVALSDASLGFVCSDLHNDVTQAVTSESLPVSLGTGPGKLWLLKCKVRDVWSLFILCR